MIGINATFKDDGEIFTVKLLCDGDHEMADALLILDIDSSQIKISYRKDGARETPITVHRCHCIPNNDLQLYIETEAKRFKITLNEKKLENLPYDFPLKMVKYIWIDGDIDLTKVALPDEDQTQTPCCPGK
ncbi:uncharacterized protein LOC112566809 [Pomacea canaliculata]|nr:uncharacterized protein LOC112566809 [Pomacea canaliculata]